MNARSLHLLGLLFLFSAVAAYGCQPSSTTAGLDTKTIMGGVEPGNSEGRVHSMEMKSSFENAAQIDGKHTGEGKDLSPALSWSDAPGSTKSFALICDDPDAPSPKKPSPTPWVHWVIYNIPGSVTQLPEGLPRVAEPAEVSGGQQGRNSFSSDNQGYRGPMPPPGSGPHRYFFRLYALDAPLKLNPRDATKESLLQAMQGHIVATGQIMGKYER